MLSPCVSDHTRHWTNQLTPSLLLNEHHGFEDRRGELPAIISARAWGVPRLGFSRNDAHGRSRGLIIGPNGVVGVLLVILLILALTGRV
jgi:hypothetical protein